MKWTLGEETISKLLSSGELQRVSRAADLADALIDSASTHLTTAAGISPDDPEAAYTIAYDASRKACAALLQAQGLRVTSKGGHIAVREAVVAQFGHPPKGQVLRRLDQMRRRRNELEYPGSAGGPMSPEELAEARSWAQDIVDYCGALLPQLDRPF